MHSFPACVRAPDAIANKTLGFRVWGMVCPHMMVPAAYGPVSIVRINSVAFALFVRVSASKGLDAIISHDQKVPWIVIGHNGNT